MSKSEVRLSRIERSIRAANASATAVLAKLDVHVFLKKAKYVKHDVVGRVSLLKVLGLES